MERLSLSEWMIIEPTLSGLVDSCKRRIRAIAETAALIDERFLTASVTIQQDLLSSGNSPQPSLDLDLQRPLPSLVFGQLREAVDSLRACKRDNEADSLWAIGTSSTTESVVRTRLYAEALLMDLKPGDASGDVRTNGSSPLLCKAVGRPRRPGRPKLSNEEYSRCVKFADSWENNRLKWSSKLECARHHGFNTLKQADRALDVVRKRRKRAKEGRSNHPRQPTARSVVS